MLALEKETMKTMALKTKDLMLKDLSGKVEYDHGKMILAQRQMFMITTVIVLIIEILLIGWKLGSYFWKLSFDDAIKSQCTDHWHFKDSSITELLTCFMISMPIQQFISCFYVIPLEHGFFSERNHGSFAGGEGDDKKTDEEDGVLGEKRKLLNTSKPPD